MAATAEKVRTPSVEEFLDFATGVPPEVPLAMLYVLLTQHPTSQADFESKVEGLLPEFREQLDEFIAGQLEKLLGSVGPVPPPANSGLL